MLPVKPLGTDVNALPPAAGTREFQGYRMGDDGVPTMLYTLDGQTVEDTLRPSGGGFERIVTINGKTTKEAISW
jgi:hypothetical protein